MTHILMVAAENGALPGGKVGGIGDVVREIPPALAKRDCQVSVVTPAYGVFATLAGATRIASLEVSFCGESQALELFEFAEFTVTIRRADPSNRMPANSRFSASRLPKPLKGVSLPISTCCIYTTGTPPSCSSCDTTTPLTRS